MRAALARAWSHYLTNVSITAEISNGRLNELQQSSRFQLLQQQTPRKQKPKKLQHDDAPPRQRRRRRGRGVLSLVCVQTNQTGRNQTKPDRTGPDQRKTTLNATLLGANFIFFNIYCQNIFGANFHTAKKIRCMKCSKQRFCFLLMNSPLLATQKKRWGN